MDSAFELNSPFRKVPVFAILGTCKVKITIARYVRTHNCGATFTARFAILRAFHDLKEAPEINVIRGGVVFHGFQDISVSSAAIVDGHESWSLSECKHLTATRFLVTLVAKAAPDIVDIGLLAFVVFERD